jgi:hypothetical protein
VHKGNQLVRVLDKHGFYLVIARWESEDFSQVCHVTSHRNCRNRVAIAVEAGKYLLVAAISLLGCIRMRFVGPDCKVRPSGPSLVESKDELCRGMVVCHHRRIIGKLSPKGSRVAIAPEYASRLY